jgi:hypothetical protein
MKRENVVAHAIRPHLQGASSFHAQQLGAAMLSG